MRIERNMVLDSKCGEAVDQNSLLAAARSRKVDVGDGPRCCGQGFFAYFLFPKKVGEMAVSLEITGLIKSNK